VAALRRAGSYQDAESRLYEAKRHAARSGRPEVLPLIHAELGLTHHYQGHSAEALAAAREAHRLADRLDDHRVAAAALRLTGELQLELGEPDTAAESLRSAHALAVALGDRRPAALALAALGTVAQHRGDLVAAFDLHDQATAALAGVDPHPVAVELGLRLADTHRAAGSGEEAEALLRSCLELAEHAGDLRATARALRGLAQCLPATSEAQLYNARATAILRRTGSHGHAPGARGPLAAVAPAGLPHTVAAQVTR